VATIRALKMHGGVPKNELTNENIMALEKGLENLKKHTETISQFGLPFVVAINRFSADTESEIDVLEKWCSSHSIPVALTEVWEKGGQGGVELAEKVLAEIEQNQGTFNYLYDISASLEEKIRTIVQKVYGGKDVEFSVKALKQLKDFEELGWGELPVCMAKTQYSLSDDPKKLGRPRDFIIHVRELKPKLGAGFIVALTGEMMTMPGLPKKPAAYQMDVDEQGRASGLF
ncbi:MAG TPA: formate--tetrahydrofolate ligase, partial [Bacillaceae bacterium]